ncbi:MULTISPECIES: DUF1311 domain-containing protein [unclassified Kosakonia]|uniref:DUF1311 domain-containing protein n=1 Tax=unclassified Kosakonia TaxID=2632876 RepID=UPI0031B6D91D
MQIIKIALVIVSLSIFSAGAITLDSGKAIQQCLTLPAYGDEKNQTQCKEDLKNKSEKSLQETIAKIKTRINNDYDTPYHLNDPEGSEIKDLFWERFNKSQQLWIASRNEFCAASALLVGEWAASQDDLQTQCIINQNTDREQLLKATYIK